MGEEEQPNVRDRLAKLEKKRGKGKAQDAIARALRRTMKKSDDPFLEDFREDLFLELRKMIKPAIAQAKKGKPALLRILTRYGK